MNNVKFLRTIKESFIKFLKTHSNSPEKLKILHGAIARDIKGRLGGEYEIKSYEIGNGKEGKMKGHYMEKTVDVLIKKDGNALAGVGIKFVMNNYSQNSNNYFEGMLGETANIRSGGKDYFQILIIPEEMPYYHDGGKIGHWEKITSHNIDKYVALSKDDTTKYLHSPTKTLVFIIKFPEADRVGVASRAQYKKYYLDKMKNSTINMSKNKYGSFEKAVIFNDYETFIKKITHYIKSI